MDWKLTFKVAVIVSVVVSSVSAVIGWILKEWLQPNLIFPACVAIDPVGWLVLVLGVSALALSVWGWVRK
jgi:hypothetical protein